MKTVDYLQMATKSGHVVLEMDVDVNRFDEEYYFCQGRNATNRRLLIHDVVFVTLKDHERPLIGRVSCSGRPGDMMYVIVKKPCE